jgi:hypothetical protein
LFGRWFIPLIGLLGFAAFELAVVRSADIPAPDVFTVSLADGTTLTGPFEALAEDWSVRLGGVGPRKVPGDAVLALRRAREARPPFPGGEQVILSNGDRIPGKVLKLIGDRLHLGSDVGKNRVLILPLTALSVIWVAAPDNTDYPDRLRRQLAAGRTRADTVLLRNGDAVEGLLASLDCDSQLRVERNKKNVQVAFPKVAAIALSTDLTRLSPRAEPRARLVLADGCRLTLANARVDGVQLTGSTTFGAEVSVPTEKIIALDLFQRRTVYLSDLKPVSYDSTSFLGTVRWPLVLDGSVVDGTSAGGDIRLGGSTYEKGLGMHSSSEVTFDLGGRYRRFEALVGLDDSRGRAGTVRAKVFVGKQPRTLTWDKELTWNEGPRSVGINVEGAKELTLVVEFGRFGDVQDHVNWAEARLIK